MYVVIQQDTPVLDASSVDHKVNTGTGLANVQPWLLVLLNLEKSYTFYIDLTSNLEDVTQVFKSP